MKKFLLTLLLLCFCSSTWANNSAAELEQARKDYINAFFTSISAASCLGVYLPEDSSEFKYLREHGWNVMTYRQENGKVETNFALAHTYIKDINKDIYLVTIRGSATKKDWNINFKTSQVLYEDNVIPADAGKNADKNMPKVHEGFMKYTDTIVLNSVVDENKNFKGIFKEILNNPDAHLVLTGHSLGGAVATLLSERLVSLGMPKDKMTTVTFGAPAVGNKAFAEQYGEKINLIRITNTADPVPGSLQTFFGGYKQFGYHYKYHLSPKITSKQHGMAVYYDHSISEYFKKYDECVRLGILKASPNYKYTEDQPIVALWINSSPQIDKMKYVPDIKRLVINEFKMMLPSFVVMDKPKDYDELPSHSEILSLSKEVGAEYVLIFGIDGNIPKEKDSYWYLTLTQVLFKTDGQLLNISTFAKKVNPAAGNITAAGESIHQAREELLKKLPFLQTTYEAKVYGL